MGAEAALVERGPATGGSTTTVAGGTVWWGNVTAFTRWGAVEERL